MYIICTVHLQLAADASNAIAMTDEEKKRLDSLLLDVDTIDELPETMGDCLVGTWLCLVHNVGTNKIVIKYIAAIQF